MNDALFTPTRQDERCPRCGAALQLKRGKKGLFLGCSAYPACDYLKPLQAAYKVIKELNEKCPECGRNLQLKQGGFGMFIGCGGYPQCHFIVHEKTPAPAADYPCPECRKGRLIARKGRQGRIFYGCDRFPKCRFTLNAEPHLIDCPQCGGKVCSIKKRQGNLIGWQCANRACQHVFTTE